MRRRASLHMFGRQIAVPKSNFGFRFMEDFSPSTTSCIPSSKASETFMGKGWIKYEEDIRSTSRIFSSKVGNSGVTQFAIRDHDKDFYW